MNKEYKSFLLEVLKSEVESRNNNAIVKRIKRAGFPTLKRFEELVKEYLSQDAQNRLEGLKSLEFLKQNRNVIMLGNSGTGKTHLATAIGIQACEKGYTTSFKTVAGLVNELKEAKSEKQLVKYARIFEKYDVVILDGLGYILSCRLRLRALQKTVERSGKWKGCCHRQLHSFDVEGGKLLFQYIAMRYEPKSTIITTSLIFSDWIKIFHDKALTMALLDRITHNAIILNMNGKSYRRRQTNKSKP